MGDLGHGWKLASETAPPTPESKDLGGGWTVEVSEKPEQSERPPAEPTPAAVEPLRRSRTGQLYRSTPPGSMPILDAPRRGIESIREGLPAIAPIVTAGSIPAAAAEAAKDPKGAARGATKIISGALELGTPLLPAAIAAAPVDALMTLGASMLVDKLTEKGLQAAGVDEAYAELAGTLAGVATGGAVGSRAVKGKLSKAALERRSAREQRASTQPSAKGEAPKMEVLPAEEPVAGSRATSEPAAAPAEVVQLGKGWKLKAPDPPGLVASSPAAISPIAELRNKTIAPVMPAANTIGPEIPTAVAPVPGAPEPTATIEPPVKPAPAPGGLKNDPLVQRAKADLVEIVKRKKPAAAPVEPETGSVFDDVPAAKQRIKKRAKDEKGESGFGQKEAAGLFDDLVTVGRSYIEQAKGSFSKWRDSMVSDFGTWVKPRLVKIWEAAKLPGGSERGSFSRKKVSPIDQGPDFTKRPTKAKDLAQFLKPTITRIAAEGKPGQALAKKLTRAQDIGEVTAGKRVVKLQDSGLSKLSREDRSNLVEALEGRANPRNPAVQKAFDAVRDVTDEIAGAARSSGVRVKVKKTLRPGDPLPPGVTLTKAQDQKIAAGEKVAITYSRPFRGRQNYFPHVVPSVEDLGRGAVRRDVLDNIVSQGIRPDTSTAAVFVDEYRKFIDEGGRAKALETHLVDSGQARDADEAYSMLRLMRRRAIKRQGNLEYARTAELPFYDPDPARVLPRFVTGSSMRLAQVREFGQETRKGPIGKLTRMIDRAGGNATFVNAAVDRALGVVNKSDDAAERLSQAVRMVQGFKLGLSMIPNATQGAMNSLLKSDLPSTLAGGRAVFTAKGRRFALESGATLDGVINEMLRSVGADNSALGKFLKGVGFTPTEQANRVWAANAGHTYAKRMLARLQKNPTDGRARKVLTELGLKPDVLLRIGKLDGDAALIAAKKFSDMTQFRSGVLDLPFFASSPLGKVAFQFKSFIYGQTRLVYDELVDELKAKRFGRGFRTLLILGTVFPLAGEAVQDLRSWITGRERKTEGLKRYFENVAQGGALGVIHDMLQASSYGKAANWMIGPTGSDVADLTNAISEGSKKKNPTTADEVNVRMRNLGRLAFRRIPLMGPVLYNRVFPPAKKK